MNKTELAQALVTEGAVETQQVVGAERQLARPDRSCRRRWVDDGDRLGGAAANVQAPARDLAGATVDDRVR